MPVLSLVAAALFAGAPAATATVNVAQFAAETPTLAAKTQHADQYIFFPQTLQRVSYLVRDTLLIS